ncbi:MAG: PAS domain-containing protein, partial [Bacteroidia bacterium]|nr:PAS domain-containing protein [Bacteroidia bacterium]
MLSNDIASIFLDDDNVLWLGTWGYGLNWYNRNTFKIEYFTTSSGKGKRLTDNYVHSIFQDNEGLIWLGTQNGISIYDKSKGLFYDLNEYYTWLENNIFNNNRIYSICEDYSNNIWIGTINGLTKISKSNQQVVNYLTNFQDSTSLCNNRVMAIICTNDGNIFIGTSGGLNKYLPETDNFLQFKNELNNSNSLINNKIYCLLEDHEGYIWIGTQSGICRFDRQNMTFTGIKDNEGLHLNVLVYDIQEDNNGNMWFSTNNGIFVINRKSGHIRFYDNYDGLQGLEFNKGATFKSKEGEHFFGGINGFNSFFPDELYDNPYLPFVVITKLIKENESGQKQYYIKGLEEIVMDYSYYFITVEFAALEFTKPEKNQFMYMMEGMSHEWIQNGNKNFVTFLNIKPGNYILNIKASNNDGKWNENPAKLRIIVKPPWWNTGWAYLGYFCCIILLIFVFIKIRVKNLIKAKKVLERRVEERTIEIQQKNKELEKLSIAASKTANAITIFDKDGTIEWRNQAFFYLYGEILGEVVLKIGQNLNNLGKEHIVFPYFKKCIETKQSVIYSLKKRTSANDYLWIQTTLTPILDKDNNVYKLVSIDSDITDIIKADEIIIEQSKELEKLSIVASKTDCSVTIASPEGEIEWVNDGFTKLYGYKLEEFKRERNSNMLQASFHTDFYNKYSQCIKGKESVTYITLTQNRDGRDIWVQTNLIPILDNAGNLKNIVAVDTDVS